MSSSKLDAYLGEATTVRCFIGFYMTATQNKLPLSLQSAAWNVKAKCAPGYQWSNGARGEITYMCNCHKKGSWPTNKLHCVKQGK